MTNEERKERQKTRSAGRPVQEDKSLIKDKKVMMSFTQDEYDELKRLQKLLNQPTLTATLYDFLERGKKSLQSEFSSQR
ncbi:MAG: hypothetical protein COA66_09915 [Arcobacter sp.]|nr:MAG: hypothetical protein COA66_09915 [Arcobacter sp.]